MKVVLYTIKCPKCLVLEKKLEQIGIEYEVVSDEQIMADKGFRSAPMLEVDGEIFDFPQAVAWVNAHRG